MYVPVVPARIFCQYLNVPVPVYAAAAAKRCLSRDMIYAIFAPHHFFLTNYGNPAPVP
jgi:hypothetical protein